MESSVRSPAIAQIATNCVSQLNTFGVIWCKVLRLLLNLILCRWEQRLESTM